MMAANPQIYLGPGQMPIDAISQPDQSQLANILGTALGTASGAVGFLPELLLKTVRGALAAGDMGAQSSQSFGGQIMDEMVGTNQSNLFANARKSIPESFYPAIENALSLGNRQKIVDAGGEAGLGLGETYGSFTVPLGIATHAGAQTADALNKAFDIASVFPGEAIMGGAKSIPGILGRSAVVGGGSSILPSLDESYDAGTGKFSMGTFATGLGLGTAMGTALPAAFLAKPIAQGAKAALNEMTRNVSGMIKQSDTMKIVSNMSKQKYAQEMQAQQYQQAQQQAQQQVEANVTGKIIDRPFEGQQQEIQTQSIKPYAEAQPAAKPQEEIRQQFLNDKQQIETEHQNAITKLEEQSRTIDEFIKEAENTTHEVSDKEISAQYEGPKTNNEIYKAVRDEKSKIIQEEQGRLNSEMETAQGKLNTLKDLMDNRIGEEQLSKEMPRPPKEVLAELQTRVDTLQSQIDKNNKILEKTIVVKKAEFEAKAKQVAEEKQKLKESLLAKKQQDNQKLVQDLKAERDKLTQMYDKTVEEQYQMETFMKQEEPAAPAKPQLPARIEQPVNQEPAKGTGFTLPNRTDVPSVIQSPGESQLYVVETPNQGAGIVERNGKIQGASFVNKPKRIKIGDKSGLTVYADPKTGKLKVKGTSTLNNIVNKTPITVEQAMQMKNKKTTETTPIFNKLMRVSRAAGGAFKRLMTNERFYVQEIKESLKPLRKALQKYQNDKAIMNHILNIHKPERLALLPEDLRQAITEAQKVFNKNYKELKKLGFEMPEKLSTYFMRHVKEVEAVRALMGQKVEDALASEFSRQGAIEDKSRPYETKAILNKALEKSRVIDEVTPEMQPLFEHPVDMIDRYAYEIGTERAKGEFFGGKMQRPLGELVYDFTSKLPDVRNDFRKTKIIGDNLFQYFGDTNFTPSLGYEVYLNTVSLLALTGERTAIKQLDSFFSNWERLGPNEAIMGYFNVPNSNLKLEKTGMAGQLQNFNDVKQMEAMSNFISYMQRDDIHALQKAGALYHELAFTPLAAMDFIDKKSSYFASYLWLRNHIDTPKVDAFFQKYEYAFTPKEIETIKSQLRDLKKNPNQVVPDEVYRAVDALAGERIVTGKGDKPARALSKQEWQRATNVLYSFAWKTAADMYDRTAHLIGQGIKEKDPKKFAIAAKNTAMILGVTLPGFALMSTWLKGDLQNVIDRATQGDMEGVKEAYIGQAAQTLAPMATRIFNVYDRSQKTEAPLTAIAEGVLPGSGTAAETLWPVVKGFAEGDPAGIITPRVNPKMVNLPPRVLTNYIYKNSDVFKEDQAAKQIAAYDKSPKAKEADEQSKRDEWLKVKTEEANSPNPNPEILNDLDRKYIGKTRGNRALQRAKTKKADRAAKYGGALTREEAVIPRIREKADLANRVLIQRDVITLLRAGRITETQAYDILSKLKQAGYKASQADQRAGLIK